jgi:hypothetical protein
MGIRSRLKRNKKRQTLREAKRHVRQALPIIENTFGKKECGECQVCCEWLNILELNKRKGHRCHHQDYLCGYRVSPFGESFRPDKLGIFITEDQYASGPLTGQKFLCFYEIRPGAMDDVATLKPVYEWFSMQYKLPIVSYRFGTPRIGLLFGNPLYIFADEMARVEFDPAKMQTIFGNLIGL